MENNTQDVTLETLPKHFVQLARDVSEIKRLVKLLEKGGERTTEPDEWHDLDWLAGYTRLARATLYPKLANLEIPGHKQGKKWYFLKSEIDNYLKQGKRKTLAEIDAAADAAIIQKEFAI